MSDYQDAMVDATDALYEAAGLDAEYSVGATPCTIVVDRNLATYGDQVEVATPDNAVIRVRISEVEAMPQYGSTFTEDDSGTVWTVERPVFTTSWEYGVQCHG